MHACMLLYQVERWAGQLQVGCMTHACTIPVTSCECERDGSVLRHLNTYKRSSMTNERLTFLALMTIHYNHAIDLHKVIHIFQQVHPRRMRLNTLLC